MLFFSKVNLTQNKGVYLNLELSSLPDNKLLYSKAILAICSAVSLTKTFL